LFGSKILYFLDRKDAEEKAENTVVASNVTGPMIAIPNKLGAHPNIHQ
jgi:hypothetical protein